MKIIAILTILIIMMYPMAFAAKRITLVNGSGVETGTSTNPIVIE